MSDQTIPDAAVELCPSSMHATNHWVAREWGAFDDPNDDGPPRRVKFCHPCARTRRQLGLFVPESAK